MANESLFERNALVKPGTDAMGGATSRLKNTRMNLSRVKENEFTLEHPDVIRYTRRFSQEAQIARMFKTIRTITHHPSYEVAVAVGAAWLAFSEWVPAFLAQAAAKASNNSVRHFLVQILFEELGCRNRNQIHSKLFADAMDSISINAGDIEWIQKKHCHALFQLLESQLCNVRAAKSDGQLFGLNLGLEINADENIESVFKALVYEPTLSDVLARSTFFRIHWVVEVEHKRLNIANFLRFCDNETKRQHFRRGFQQSIAFWNHFWEFTSTLASRNTERGFISS